ncbi:hypothetical protein DIPPA_33410 [Diplonema papillatum]|nr:hypothetical protein DIPPA_33410 [Diplonema papillatum]
MMPGRHRRTRQLIAFLLIALILALSSNKLLPAQSQTPFSITPLRSEPSLPTRPGVATIYDLPAYLRGLPDRSLVDRLFVIEEKTGRLEVPETFISRVKAMFAAYPKGTDSLHFVEAQKLISVRNKVTYEHTLFNEIRKYRPGYSDRVSDEQDALIRKQIEDTQGSGCDFCNLGRTAADIFGRIESEHCYVAANVAKYEKWHSLLISREHSPLKISKAAVRDYLSTAHKWFATIRKLDASAVAPHLMWDSTGRASASQLHQHMQMVVSTAYFHRAEIMRQQCLQYSAAHGSNLWADTVAVHQQLGLAVTRGNNALFVSLAPVKEREVIVVGNSRDPAFADLLHMAVAGLLDSGVRAFSAAIVFEPLDGKGTTPAVARIIDRGTPNDVRNDVGAMEFYGSNNVAQDPFELMQKILNFAGHEGV